MEFRLARQLGPDDRPGADGGSVYSLRRWDRFSLAADARREAAGYHSTSGRSPGLKFNPSEARYSAWVSAAAQAIS